MAKSIKLKNNTYIDSTGITHNRDLLSNILTANLNKNVSFVELAVDSVNVNTSPSYQILDYTIPQDGTYLITGVVHPNHYGQSGRELVVNVARNWSVFYTNHGVCNTYTWTLSMPISAIYPFKKGDKLEVYITNSDNTKNWSNSGGSLFLIKLNNDSY